MKTLKAAVATLHDAVSKVEADTSLLGDSRITPLYEKIVALANEFTTAVSSIGRERIPFSNLGNLESEVSDLLVYCGLILEDVVGKSHCADGHTVKFTGIYRDEDSPHQEAVETLIGYTLKLTTAEKHEVVLVNTSRPGSLGQPSLTEQEIARNVIISFFTKSAREKYDLFIKETKALEDHECLSCFLTGVMIVYTNAHGQICPRAEGVKAKAFIIDQTGRDPAAICFTAISEGVFVIKDSKGVLHEANGNMSASTRKVLASALENYVRLVGTFALPPLLKKECKHA